jgi:HTH-type transcriptional regulator/antitoxin HigA
MLNRLIKTEKDYNFALSRIEELMDAQKNTPEADELELLAALVEMYEDEHYPMDLPDPVDALKFRMEQLGLNQQGLVPFIGSRSKVSEVLNRKKKLTLAMMRALHNGLGIPADVFLRESGAAFPDSMPDVDWTRFPVVEMAKRCWLPKVDDIKGKAEELMRALINRAGGFQTVSAVLFRKGTSARFNAKTDIYALTAWCLRVLSLAREVDLDHKYKKGSLNANALRDIAKLSYFENGPLLAKEYLNKQGIHLIVASHLTRTYLDGAAMLLPDGTPVVGLTLRYDRIDNFWFCLLHELAHVAKHLSVPGKMFVDDLDLRGHEVEVADTKEKQADDMAIEALIPRKIWQQHPIQGKATGPKIQALAEWIKIHPAIIAGRIRFEQKNYKLLSKYVGNKEIRKHFKESCSGAI